MPSETDKLMWPARKFEDTNIGRFVRFLEQGDTIDGHNGTPVESQAKISTYQIFGWFVYFGQ